MSNKRDKDDDDEGEVSPFDGIRKNQVLQEIKLFNKTTISPRACCNTLTKIMYLVQQGEVFSNEENTQIFFSVTKLFQNQDAALRRLVHLVIKSLDTKQNEVLIVTSSLCQDINNSKIDSFRSNALRVLAKIIDAPMLAQVDRFFKQAIVDKIEFTASSALVAGIHLFPMGSDVVKRWANEVQESVNNKSRMVQYHALHLLHLIKRNDRLAIQKVIFTMVKNPPKSPLTLCLLIRYVAAVMNDSFDLSGGVHDKILLDFITSMLRNKNSMVVYEASREFSRLKGVTGMQLVPVVVALQDFLNSPLSTHRFSAVRTLALIVERFPHLVTSLAVDLERLISDSNRSTATLAITTLLKTGVEASIDRLLKTISGFMSEIVDEFKIVVVEAIRSLGIKFPAKFSPLIKFLSSMLREDGGFEYKKCILSACLSLMSISAEAKDLGLDALCEFIEDCEFTELSVQTLHVLAAEANNIKNPARFIRHIFNRVILECEPVRSGAVSALAKIGGSVVETRDSVLVLLNRCLYDVDDETRDRATLYISMLKQDEHRRKVLQQSLSFPTSIANMEFSVRAYLNAGDFSVPFTVDSLQIAPDEALTLDVSPDEPHSTSGLVPVLPELKNQFQDEMERVPALKSLQLGVIFKTAKVVLLTESESEYQVKCFKHMFENHVILQFEILNTLADQTIDDVKVELDMTSTDWTEKVSIGCGPLQTDKSGVSYLCLERGSDYFMGPVSCVLKYLLRDSTESSGGIPDEYNLEDVEVVASDFVSTIVPSAPQGLGLVEFKRMWENTGNESVKKYSLSIKTLQDAVNAVLDFVGLGVIESSNQVPDGASSHAVNLAGSFVGGKVVLTRAAFMIDSKSGGVSLKIAARSEYNEISELITNSIQ